ncbi:hypothetical protein [Candidatus Methanodesulfokora washburnensis]|uniref:Uncharacterized protein n=1 Tax=Candidatus Methanodesulfokora washburnensis TaxID=2478471 RepID=A0A3R9X3Q4_9CREN|nr:hypothetical protein [Candidatus Methanodesulfokores washburnensis]RSN74563.1 hypothetical protein D6D85_07875 [Candidatus Methanodesulfokores washburnensis]
MQDASREQDAELSKPALQIQKHEQLIKSAYSGVKGELEKLKEGVIVLVPCGCSRGKLLELLIKQSEGLFSRAYVYRGFRIGAEEIKQRVERYESLQELDKLKKRKGELVIVVPESSWDAVCLRSMLGKRVKLLYLPELYEKAIKEVKGFSEEVCKLAKVEHPRLRKMLEVKAKGLSSTLLREWGEKLDDLEKGKKAILELSPRKLGLRDYLRDIVVKASTAAVAVLPSPLIASGISVLLIIGKLLLSEERNLQDLISNILESLKDFLAKPPSKLELLFDTLAEGPITRILEGWSKDEAKSKVAEGFAKLVVAAREAEPYLDREELEAVWDQVALEWRMQTPLFKVLVGNLAKMTHGELMTREELERRIKQLVEDRLAKIEKDLEKVKQEVESLKIGVKLFYAYELEEGLLFPFKVEKGRPLLKGDKDKVKLVTAGRFGELPEEILRKLEGGFVVLEGPKGIGKSTLAIYSAWLGLLRGLVSSIATVDKLERGQRSVFMNLLEIMESVEGTGTKLLVFYDPSPLKAYFEPGAFSKEIRKAIKSVEETLYELLRLAKTDRRTKVIAVLSSDIYGMLSEELKQELENSNRIVHVDLQDHTFLEGIIRTYSGCTGDFRELVERIKELESSYTLVAKYAGLWLYEKGCELGDVKVAVEEAKKKPKLFLAQYLWRVLLGGKKDLARRVAIPLFLHAAFGPVPEGLTYLTKASNKPGFWSFLKPSELEERKVSLQDLKEDELEPLARWLSVRHEDLMEETLMEICIYSCARATPFFFGSLMFDIMMTLERNGSYYYMCKELDQALREDLIETLGQALGEALEEVTELYKQEFEDLIETLGQALGEALEEVGGSKTEADALLEFVGIRLEAVFKANLSHCWRRLALISGFTLAGYSNLPKTVMNSEKEEAFKPCTEVDSYLLLGSKISPFFMELALNPEPKWYSISRVLAGVHEEAAEELEKLVEKYCTTKRIYKPELLYALGLAISIAGAAELGMSVEEKSVKAATLVVKEGFRAVYKKENVLKILEMLKSFESIAPHYYTLFFPNALELIGRQGWPLICDSEIHDMLEELLENHLHKLEKHVWPLVEIISAYSQLISVLLRMSLIGALFKGKKVQIPIGALFEGKKAQILRISELLEDLRNRSDQLYTIAEVQVLMVMHGFLSSEDVKKKAEELIGRIRKLKRENPDKYTIEWAEMRLFSGLKGVSQLIESYELSLLNMLQQQYK